MAWRSTAFLVTIGLWVVLTTGLGYWRAYYAWHWGSFYIFLFHDVPILAVALALILFFEHWYFRYKIPESNPTLHRH
jgi:hypothetical protein